MSSVTAVLRTSTLPVSPSPVTSQPAFSARRSKKIRDWLAAHPDDAGLHFLPPYSPELNPDEPVNADLRHSPPTLSRRPPRHHPARTATPRLRGSNPQRARLPRGTSGLRRRAVHLVSGADGVGVGERLDGRPQAGGSGHDRRTDGKGTLEGLGPDRSKESAS
ncbi:transposase [Streptomyces capoamus]|uniref:transposase n=1 Tax=Streptomyces capoamus TaxID=68183 RepID=UPI00351A775B